MSVWVDEVTDIVARGGCMIHPRFHGSSKICYGIGHAAYMLQQVGSIRRALMNKCPVSDRMAGL